MVGFDRAIHEIGHAAILPFGSWTHVSLMNPCALCPTRENFVRGSEGHVALIGDFNLVTLDELLLGVAGGASEVACSLNPTYVPYDAYGLGQFPDGMANDFEDLKKRIGSEEWEKWIPALDALFQFVVEHCRKHISLIRELASKLFEHHALRSNQLNFNSFNRDMLFNAIMEMSGD